MHHIGMSLVYEQDRLYLVTQSPRGWWVRKFHSWTAKKYIIDDDLDGNAEEVLVEELLENGEIGMGYRIPLDVPVFDMTHSSSSGGYTLRKAADLPDMQPRP